MKKKLSFVCCAIASVITLNALYACAEQNAVTGQSVQTETYVTEETVPETEAENLFPPIEYEFPHEDYNGHTFRILTRGPYVTEMDSEELDGEILNDSIYARNLAVEERYNITIEAYATDDDGHGPTSVRKIVQSGDTSTDLIVGSCYGIMPLTVNNLFYDLNTLENLDLSTRCWSQMLKEAATIYGRTFIASGSIALQYFKRTYALAVNRNLSESFGIKIDDIYSSVLGGTWTLDHMIDLTKDIYVDTNGDSLFDKDDVYGCGILLNCMNDGWWTSCDISLFKKDEEGGVYLDCDINKLETINSKLRDYVWISGGVLPMSEDTIYSREITANGTENPFYEDKLCMTTIRLHFTDSAKMREMQADYGIVPYPKFNENQEDYYSYIHDAFSIVMIPLSCSDPEMSAAVMQALAVEGYNQVMPAYYGVVLTEKYARDKESVKMLDIIFSNVNLDTGWLFSSFLNGLPQKLLREQVWKNEDTLQSTYEKMQKSINKSIDKINAAYSAG